MPEIKPFEVIWPEIEKYRPFVIDLFRFLNGYINPNNPCRLYINMYHNTNFAEYAKPDIITVYLGSIVDHYFGNDAMIKKIIIVAVSHELSHSIQNLDMVRYSNDPYYRDTVEKQNEGRTELWLTAHEQEIYQRFGVHIKFSDLAIKNTHPHGYDYEQAAMREYYLNVIMDVIYRNNKARTVLSDLFDANQTIAFQLNDSDKVLLKYKGIYNDRGIYSFNQIVNDHCRRGAYITYFKIKTEIKHEDIFGENGIIIHMAISDQFCKPIEF